MTKIDEIKEHVSEYPEWAGIRLVLATPEWTDSGSHWGESDAEEIETHIDAWRKREGELRAERDRLRDELHDAHGIIYKIVSSPGIYQRETAIDAAKKYMNVSS